MNNEKGNKGKLGHLGGNQRGSAKHSGQLGNLHNYDRKFKNTII
jgi:hypothetical protein